MKGTKDTINLPSRKPHSISEITNYLFVGISMTAIIIVFVQKQFSLSVYSLYTDSESIR